MLKLATWNVNSLKVRIDQVLTWFHETQTDVLALQETKMTDEQFPEQLFLDQGLHVVFSGQKSYNGVAIISRYPITDVVTNIPGYDDPQRRMLAATVSDFRLINLYVPNGMEVGSDKYHYKLIWLSYVTSFIQQQLKQYPCLAVVGDFNIAPKDEDVHDPSVWQDSVLVSPLERRAFFDLISLGLIDSYRQFKQKQHSFSWWDYKQASYRRNAGLRIDHILLSAELMDRCVSSFIDESPRQAERPSDHAPVIVELK